ncbi:MAG: hypothetical protein KDI30_02075 [Pseudomonadales bacterium]|nr:hypothetical protein [Pseudomonadales bacterium]
MFIYSALMLLVLSKTTSVFADTEIASLDYACRTAWNEMCFEQPILKAPAGTKICSYRATEIERTGDGNFRIVSVDKQHLELEISAQGSLSPINKTGSSMVVSITLLGVDENDSCITELKEEDSEPVNACVCTNAIDEIEVQWCYSSGKSRSGEDCSTFFSEAICVGTKKACKDHQREACPNTASIDLVKSRKRLYIKNSPFCTEKP